MGNLRRLVLTLKNMVDTAEENSRKLKMPFKEEEPILRTMNGDILTVAHVKGAAEEMSEGEFRIGNVAYRVVRAPKSVPTHKVCQLCAFNHRSDPQHRTCPRLSFMDFNRAFCTFIGEGSREYFEEVG